MENRLLTATGGGANLTLDYDPEGRLSKYTSGSTVTTYLYDGVNLIGEYNSSNTVLRRYVHGTGVDEPVVWFEGANIDANSRRYFYQNYQGSVIAYTNGSSVLTELYKYGPYGEPKSAANAESWTGAKFRYTGQIMLPEAKLYYYKARVYDPTFGRFLQTDPIGSDDDLNLYAYVAGDPINATDPTGTICIKKNSFCQRKERYKNLGRDEKLNGLTVFHKAAATALDILDTPRTFTRYSKSTVQWLEGVSANLERENLKVFSALKEGRSVPGITDSPDGVDRGMVRFEQGMVQDALNTLHGSNRSLYDQVVSEINESFKTGGSASGPLNVASTKLGRTPDFASEEDRRQIGYETVRQEAAWSCVQGKVCNGRTLSGK